MGNTFSVYIGTFDDLAYENILPNLMAEAPNNFELIPYHS